MNTATHVFDDAEKGSSLWHDAWLRLRKNKLALFGGGVLLFMVVVALLTPWLAPYSYEAQNLDLGATPPSAAHWLGTDIFGRDLLTQIMYGGRISLAVGFIATAVALLIGVTWGAVAGYVGGRVDAVMMRLVDILYALPFMIFIVLLMVVFGRNILLLFLAIGAVEWLTMARIMRSQVQSLRQQEFVEAAVSGRIVESAIRIPSDGLRAGDRVFVLTDDGLLDIRDVDVIHSNVAETILASGVLAGEEVITSAIRNPIPGMALEPIGTEVALGGAGETLAN